MKRKIVRLSRDTLVKPYYLQGSSPLVFQPIVDNVNLIAWAESNHEFIEQQLLKHGAILFRGFNLDSVNKFEQLITATSGDPLEYSERSSPRSQVSGNIYTSTDHPADQEIFLHNEQSYNIHFPTRIFFFCMTPAQQGGETPIADTRKVLSLISPEIRAHFAEKHYMYVRNFGDGFGLSWQTTFGTSDKAAVEDYCHKNDIGFKWKEGGRLKTTQVRRAIAEHPRTGELVWFNHATFFHFSTLESELSDKLITEFREEDLPNNTYYGDGAPIEPSVMDELRSAYLQEKVIFSWRQGDVLMLDNMLMAHGRQSYAGPRKVVVGMAGLCSWKDLSASQIPRHNL